MKKYVIIAAAGLLTTAGVTATVLGTHKKKTETKTHKTCPYAKKCARSASTACY